MKRMKKKTTYEVAATIVPSVLCNDGNDGKPPKKCKIFCDSTRKKLYILLILSSLVLAWVFIYYKLLDHRFELPEPLRELRKIFGDGPPRNRRGREEMTRNIEWPDDNNDGDTKSVFCLRQFRSSPNVKIPRNEKKINIVLVAFGNRVKEALVAMKVITLITNYNIRFYIFTDEKEDTFSKEFKSWPRYYTQYIFYSLYSSHFPVENEKEWLGLFKPAAAQRLFLASILVGTDSVIYIDTDVLFLRPPEDLWFEFKRFDKNQIAGMSPECMGETECWYTKYARHSSPPPFGVNSGVMLMNLTRMRKLNWEKELKDIHTNKKEFLVWGDQDILNIYFDQHPSYLYQLSCLWNYRTDFCMHDDPARSCNYTQGIYLLHGNRRVFENKKVQPEFYYIYEPFKKFRFDKDHFQTDITQKLEKTLTHKFKNNPCGGKISQGIVKYLKCPVYNR